VNAAGGRVSQVKQKLARLTVYCDGVDWETPEGHFVRESLDRIVSESCITCEACGGRGRHWPYDEAERTRLEHISGPRARRQLVLCESCGFRYYFEGATGWPEIRGEWSLKRDTTAADDDDDDEVWL
jgi:hypothetical protein